VLQGVHLVHFSMTAQFHIGRIYLPFLLISSKQFDCSVKSMKVTAATGMEQIGDALKGCKVVVIPAGASHDSELICIWNCIVLQLIFRLFFLSITLPSEEKH
jgi:hypothetical protein